MTEFKWMDDVKGELSGNNTKWCYAETTSCADATVHAKTRDQFLYLDNGRFGPSQTACFKNRGNITSENPVLSILVLNSLIPLISSYRTLL